VKPENGLRLLCEVVGARAKARPVPYGHWYVDGGGPASHDSALTTIAHDELTPIREALSNRIHVTGRDLFPGFSHENRGYFLGFLLVLASTFPHVFSCVVVG